MSHIVSVREEKKMEKEWKPGLDELPQTIRARQEAKRTDAALGDKLFLDCCGTAGVKPTRRQARKWLHGRGLAYTVLSDERGRRYVD